MTELRTIPPQPVYWCGEITACQVCNRDFNSIMYDANIGRTWGNICHTCFEEYGCSLGIGRGQKYEQQTDRRWLLVEGG